MPQFNLPNCIFVVFAFNDLLAYEMIMDNEKRTPYCLIRIASKWIVPPLKPLRQIKLYSNATYVWGDSSMQNRMTLKTKREIVEVFRAEYCSADLKRKTELLDAFTKATGLSRKHSITVLRKSPVTNVDSSKQKRGRRSMYNRDEIEILIKAWHLASCICSKRLQPFMPELLLELEKSGSSISRRSRTNLIGMSARTIDRLLQRERARSKRAVPTTKPGSLLRHQIPIHTRTPFQIKGIDCDNGREFMNELLIDWCKEKAISFTRSREYKKNDQAWIEEKNRSVVRKHVGHARFEGVKAAHILNQYYSVLRLYINFFQPCQKLLLKERVGSKTYKKHDAAKTPYQRVLESKHVSKKDKQLLKEQKKNLSMVVLHEELFDLGKRLRQQAIDPTSPLAAALASQRMSTFKFVEFPTEVKVNSQIDQKQNMAQRIRTHLLLFPTGHTFRPCDFRHIAPRHLIDVYFRRWMQKNTLIKVGWGRYKKA